MRGVFMHRDKLIKSEVNKLFNTTSETLRYYEQKGLINPDIQENNYRYYDFFDLQKLRQIFLFRSLGISIESIQKIMAEEISEKEYIDLLTKHQEELKVKIKNLEETSQNVDQLLKLVSSKELNYTFEIKHISERVFYAISSIDSNIMSSPKKYFEKYKSVIKGMHYSEKSLHILYDYEDLNLGNQISSKICFEVLKEGKISKQEGNNISYTTFSSGEYLSVFYEFKREDFAGLRFLKIEVDEYLKENNYKIKDHRVIEIEHPELSFFSAEGTFIYEIQILIQRK